jgi:hypothetical protein
VADRAQPEGAVTGGNLEIRVMRDDLLLAGSCIAQFASR